MNNNDPFANEILDDDFLIPIDEEIKEINHDIKDSFDLIQSFKSEIFKLEDAKREADKYIAEFQECIKVEKLKLFEKYESDIRRVEELKERYGKYCRYGDYDNLEFSYDRETKKLYFKSQFLARENIIYGIKSKMGVKMRGSKVLNIINKHSCDFELLDFDFDDISILKEVFKNEINKYIDQKFTALENKVKELYMYENDTRKSEVLDYEPNESDQIALISAVNILSNLVLIENGYFVGAEFTKDEVEQMTHLDNEDLIILSEYKEQATISLKELFNDINDGEYVELALTKLETVIFKPNELLIPIKED